MGLGLTIDQILASLESEKTAEEVFAENLVEKKAENPEPEPVEVSVATPEETPAEEAEIKEEKEAAVAEPQPVETDTTEADVVTPTNEVTSEVTSETSTEKTAEAELEESGRIIARGFFDELTKLSSVEEEEKTASESVPTDEGTQIIVNLYNRYYGDK